MSLACSKNLSITINALNRVRIKNYNPLDFDVSGCATCFLSADPDFNGEFPNYTALPVPTYERAPNVSVLGKEPTSLISGNNWVQNVGPFWILSIACDGAPGRYLWLSNAKFGASPAGIYTLNVFSSCGVGPASLEIEFY